MLAFAQRSLLEAEHVMKDIGGLDALHGSLLKIACSEGFAIDFLPGVLASFKARHRASISPYGSYRRRTRPGACATAMRTSH